MDSYKSAEDYVYHIEVDLADPSRLLFSDGNSLKVTDGWRTEIIAGSSTSGYKEGVGEEARFKIMKGFVQLSNKTVVVTDYYSHCLRQIDRPTRATSPFVGECEIFLGGFKNGYGLDAHFKEPISVIKDLSGNGLLVVEYGNSAIRYVDLLTKYVSTLLSTGLHYPTGIAYDSCKENLLITNEHYISKYNNETGNHTILTGTTERGRGSWDDPISLVNASYRYPYDLLPLTDTLLLVSDQFNNWLRLIDFENDIVYPICTGNQGSKYGTASTCWLHSNAALLLVGDTLYIGQWKSIRKIKSKHSSTFIFASKILLKNLLKR